MGEILDFNRYPNFTEAEMRCKCGCGRADMAPSFMHRLQGMRNGTLNPFIITSGFRCPDYNDRIASTGRAGPHTTGHAVDLLCAGARAHDILQLAAIAGMTGIGVAQRGPHAKRFIHLDDLPHGLAWPRPGVWSY